MSLDALMALKGSETINDVVGNMLAIGAGTLSVKMLQSAETAADGVEKPIAAVVVIQGNDTSRYLDALDTTTQLLEEEQLIEEGLTDD